LCFFLYVWAKLLCIKGLLCYSDYYSLLLSLLKYMAEIEIGWFESWNSGAEWSSEITQEDLVRVNEGLGEARKVRQGIGASVAVNSKLAEFIKFLFVNQGSNDFWDGLDCFWISNNLGEASFMARIFVACMLPLYEEKADEFWLNNEFPLDYHFMVSFQSYLSYIQKVFTAEQEVWKIDEKKFRDFLKTVITTYNIQMTEQDSLEQFNIGIPSS
jgi:hypothetical protein